MSDLISKKAVIDAIAELQGRAETKAELKGISKALKKLTKLPSAESTVDAIPISWINDWYEKNTYSEVADLLNDWAAERKEQ